MYVSLAVTYEFGQAVWQHWSPGIIQRVCAMMQTINSFAQNQVNLAVAYEQGTGCARNETAAAHWMLCAAKQDDARYFCVQRKRCVILLQPCYTYIHTYIHTHTRTLEQDNESHCVCIQSTLPVFVRLCIHTYSRNHQCFLLTQTNQAHLFPELFNTSCE